MEGIEKEDKTEKLIACVLSLCFAYAVLRYHIFKGVDWQHFPLYILNKVTAFASIIFFVLSGAKKWMSKYLAYSASRIAGFALMLAVTHSFMSVVLLSPERYAHFYEGEEFSLAGESSLTVGILALVCFLVLDRKYTYRKLNREGQLAKDHCGLIILLTWFLLLVHSLTMGWSGWLKPAEWPAYLLPISLLAFVFVAGALISGLKVKLSPQVFKAVVKSKFRISN